MTALIEVPEDLAAEIGEDAWNPWPWVTDRDGETWAASPILWSGEQVMAPFAADGRPATRSSVEAVYGPLIDQPHCPICGATSSWRDGVCARRLDSDAHPEQTRNTR